MRPIWLAKTLVLLSFLAVALPAQEPGIPPTWDVREKLGELIEQTKRFEPLLEQVKPDEWVAKGAPDAYIGQLQALKNEIGYLQRTAEELRIKPSRLSKALEAFLRVQAVNSMMSSIVDAVGRYQNPALGDLLQGVAAEVAPFNHNLRDYLVELAVTNEIELKIANEEAQRCRSELIQTR
jgi:hypothetical protein